MRIWLHSDLPNYFMSNRFLRTRDTMNYSKKINYHPVWSDMYDWYLTVLYRCAPLLSLSEVMPFTVDCFQAIDNCCWNHKSLKTALAVGIKEVLCKVKLHRVIDLNYKIRKIITCNSHWSYSKMTTAKIVGTWLWC